MKKTKAAAKKKKKPEKQLKKLNSGNTRLLQKLFKHEAQYSLLLS